MTFPTDENVLVGLDRADDAGVYRLSDDLALIQTVDFFTPIVDDPYWFGQIAAANALSDVYAMGGVPKTAMNLVGFPLKTMDISILRQVIQGGIDKMVEAEVVLVGGHSVEDSELKYGLSVTGHPSGPGSYRTTYPCRFRLPIASSFACRRPAYGPGSSATHKCPGGSQFAPSGRKWRLCLNLRCPQFHVKIIRET